MEISRLWTRDFLIDSVTNFIVYLAHYLVIVTIALYTMEHFNASAGEAGLTYGIYIIGGLVARILTGNQIDRIGRKRTLFIGLVIFLLTTFSYFIAASLGSLLIVRFLHGIGWGIAATATGIIIANIIPKKRIGEGTGYYALSVTLASAVGPFIGMLIIIQGSFNMILTLSAFLTIIALIIVCFLKVPEAAITKGQATEIKKISLNSFFEASAVPISIVGIFVGVGVASIFSFLSAYVKTIDLVMAGSFFFMVYAAAMVISRPFTGRWFDKKGENFVMYPSFILFALGLIVLSLADQGVVLLLAGILVGIGYGTFVSSAQALAVKLAPPTRVGLATSTFFSLIDFGSGIAPIFLGLLIPLTGYRGLYASSAIITFFCIFLYYFLHGRNAAVHK